jgi:hypothetical protein
MVLRGLEGCDVSQLWCVVAQIVLRGSEGCVGDLAKKGAA